VSDAKTIGYKPPFVYFGGKSSVASVVWSALGDVKGFEKPKDKEVMRLWRKYGPFPLRIVRNGITVHLIPGKGAK